MQNIIVFFMIFISIVLLIFLKPNEYIEPNENIISSEGVDLQVENENEMYSIDFFALDTHINLKARGINSNDALEECKQLIYNIENLISPYIESSEIYRINNNEGQPYQTSDIVYDIVETAIDYAKFTNGVFDPTISSVSMLWEFNSKDAKIPSQDEINLALKSVSYENIILLDDNYIQLKNDATIELGAIAKGYIADLLFEIYQKYDIESGIISLAGNIYLVGEKSENVAWTVGITDPENPNQQNIAIKLSDISVVTAGAYERYFWLDNQFYHHILDTKTGYPTTEDITSVTIISKNSTLADVLSTTLFAMGFERAIDFLEEYPDIEAIIINEDNQVYITDNTKISTIVSAKYSRASLETENAVN